MKSLIYILIALFFGFSTLPSNAFLLTVPSGKTISTKHGFLGKWKMKTIVVSSSCPDILVGSTTESKLELKSTTQSTNLKALWKGGSWKKSIGVLKLLNDNEAVTERITKIKTKRNEEWEAVLIDHLNLGDDDKIHTETIVIQYKNGQVVGEYITYSILTRSE